MTDLRPRTHLRAPPGYPMTTHIALGRQRQVWLPTGYGNEARLNESRRCWLPTVWIPTGSARSTRSLGLAATPHRGVAHTSTRPQYSRSPPQRNHLGLPWMSLEASHSSRWRGQSISLAEWAAGAGAVNLLTAETSSSAIPDDVRDDLQSVIFDGGRNGWTGPDEKAHARRHLTEHVRNGSLTPDQAASYVMSQGVSDGGAKRLRDLLK